MIAAIRPDPFGSALWLSQASLCKNNLRVPASHSDLLEELQ